MSRKTADTRAALRLLQARLCAADQQSALFAEGAELGSVAEPAALVGYQGRGWGREWGALHLGGARRLLVFNGMYACPPDQSKLNLPGPRATYMQSVRDIAQFMS